MENRFGKLFQDAEKKHKQKETENESQSKGVPREDSITYEIETIIKDETKPKYTG